MQTAPAPRILGPDGRPFPPRRVPVTEGGLKLDLQHAGYDAMGYRSDSVFREMGYNASTSTHDYEARYKRGKLVDIARDLDRNNWLFEGVVNRIVDWVLGPVGFTVQAKTDVGGVNDFIEQEVWAPFTEAPELRGMFDWTTCQRINLRELIVAGDTLWTKLGKPAGRDAGKLQHFESERIADRSEPWDEKKGSRVEQGVRLDKAGRPQAFQIAGVGSTGYISSTVEGEVRAGDCIYEMGLTRRSTASRGMPALVSVMPMGRRLEDILTSEAVAWQVASRIAVAFNTEKGLGFPPIVEDTNASERSGAETAHTDKLYSEVGHAIIFQGKIGETVTPVNHNRPNSNIEQSVKLFCRLFGVPLGVPLEMLLFDFDSLNYSSFRGLLLQAFLSFRLWQQLLVRNCISRAYRWQVGRAIADGRLTWRPSIFEHLVHVPSWPWIDEDKEVSAWGKKIDRGLATQTKALAALGEDAEEMRSNRKDEILAAHRIAKEIEEETMGEIKATEIWHHLAGMEIGKTERAVKADKDGGNSDGDSDNPAD